MKRLFNVLLAHPKLVLAAAFLAAAVGWRVGSGLSVDVFPEIREPRAAVTSFASPSMNRASSFRSRPAG